MDYTPPVSNLLNRPRASVEGEWPNYLDQGLGLEHVPELIRMATDPQLLDSEDESDFYATVHALRALGQLRSLEAVAPLLALLDDSEDEDNDWLSEELPEVLALIGPSALPQMEAFLTDRTHGLYACAAVGNGVVDMARDHPETRAECVRILTQQIEAAEHNPPDLNGFFVSDLINLKAVEAAPVMQQAFTAGHIDESIAGGWPHVAYELNLTDVKPPPIDRGFVSPWTGIGPPTRPGKTAKQKAKARRKMAKKSKQKNRKKKK